MANPSTNIPTSRLRTKTSELSDFFRHTGPSSYHVPSQKEDSTSSTLEVPSGDETSPKKKITRIPLFGRSRKKSTQSTSSSPHVTHATTTATIIRESSDVGEPSSRVLSGTDRRPTAPSSASTRAPTLPLPSKVPSLSSKLAAHFSHSRSTKVTNTQAESDSVSPAPQNTHSSGLAPPAPRSGSLESNSSAGTKARSITPQPSRPAIMVSLSTDNDDDEFKDLFTRPGPSRNVEKLKKLEQSTNSTPPASPKTGTSESSIYRRGYTPASAIAAAVRHQQTSSNGSSNRPPSTSSKNSKRNSESDKSQEQQSGTSTPRLSESRESPKLLGPEKERGLPPSLQRRSTVAIGSGHLSDNASSLRSRIKLSGSQPPSRPPSIPLPIPPRPSGPPPSAPLPPTPTSPSLPTPDSPNSPAPQYIQTVSEGLRKTHIRPRAHTMGSTSDITISTSHLTKQSDSASKPPPSPSLTVKESEPLDIENASVEDLRRALKARNKDCEELADLLVKNNDLRIAEVAALQRKVSELETTIKGLTFIINESGLQQQQQSKLPPAGVLSRSRFAVNTDLNGSDIEENQRSLISGIARSRLGYQSDSGADSHATSGCESIRASGSGPESLTSMFRNKKTRRHYPVNENAQIVQRTATMLRASKIPPAVNPEKNLPEIPSASSNMKRSSISSLYASPSSSTSSLLTPSPSITMSSLSAIPEGSGSTLPTRFPRYEPSDQQDDRRIMRVSQRASTSSLASSTTAASSSYSSNVKRSRPPSIAQVLDKSPNIENVLDKLRPFS